MYIELHTRSAFSFLEGGSLPEELISACAKQAMPAVALLDRDGVYGAPRFHMAAKKAGLRAHIGAEVSVHCQRTAANELSRSRFWAGRSAPATRRFVGGDHRLAR